MRISEKIIICVNVFSLVFIIIARVVTSRYNKELIKKDDSKDIKIPFALWIVDKFKIADKAGEKIKTSLANLSLYNNVSDVIRMHYCKKVSLCITVIMMCNIICLGSFAAKKDIRYDKLFQIDRPDYNDTQKQVFLDVTMNDDTKQNITLDVEPKALDDSEKESLFEDVYEYIDKNVVGDNDSISYVTRKLNLVDSYPNDDNVKIAWLTDDDGLVDEEGYVKNIDATVVLTAIVTYLDDRKEHQINVSLKQHKDIDEDAVINQIKKSVSDQNDNNADEDSISLPSDVDGVSLQYTNHSDSGLETVLLIIVISIIAIVLIIILKDKEIDTKMKERNESLLLDYPKLLNKFALLLSAGYTIKKVWEKICFDEADLLEANSDILLMDNDINKTNELLEYNIETKDKRVGNVVSLSKVRLTKDELTKVELTKDEFIKDERINFFEEKVNEDEWKNNILQGSNKDNFKLKKQRIKDNNIKKEHIDKYTEIQKKKNKRTKEEKKKNKITKQEKKKNKITKEEKKKRTKNKKIGFVYSEMMYSLFQMYGGKSEIDTYEDFGKRVGLVQYMKLSSLFIQSIVSGVSNIVDILEIESLEAQKDKIECIKQQGKKIGTRLLLPMMGLLAITLVLVIVPVLLSAF